MKSVFSACFESLFVISSAFKGIGIDFGIDCELELVGTHRLPLKPHGLVGPNAKGLHHHFLPCGYLQLFSGLQDHVFGVAGRQIKTLEDALAVLKSAQAPEAKP